MRVYSWAEIQTQASVHTFSAILPIHMLKDMDKCNPIDYAFIVDCKNQVCVKSGMFILFWQGTLKARIKVENFKMVKTWPKKMRK